MAAEQPGQGWSQSGTEHHVLDDQLPLVPE